MRKRRELEPAKLAERQAQKGTCPHSAIQSDGEWYSFDTWDTAYSTVLKSRKMDTRNGETRQVLSQVKLEKATRPQALAE